MARISGKNLVLGRGLAHWGVLVLSRFESVFFALQQPGDVRAVAIDDEGGHKQAEYTER